ncbi:type VI secretion system-associated FHA domain protein TagH [Simiduia litorea]|uniref:type VI secretion system-associated FHA domain protein TagH n=1 Tax=Simiduia litorea TaxID=1435348 RepID=UPI0036F2865A
MDLILTVIAEPASTNMLNHTKVFSQKGGTLGRAESNQWVLPDPSRVVSSQHCKIQFNESGYQLLDVSTNGLFINDSEQALGAEKLHPLKDGDFFTLGDYKLRANLRQAKEKSNLPKGLGAVDFLDTSDKTTFSAGMEPQLEAQKNAQQFDSWLDGKEPTPAPSSDEWGYNHDNANSPLTKSDAPADPLDYFSQAPQPQIDPLAQFDAPSISQSAPKWEDDWWKDGTTDDHAEPLSHNISTPKVKPQNPAPANEFSSQPVAPRVNPAPVAPPVPVNPPPQAFSTSAEPNPFAASAELLHGSPAPTTSAPNNPIPVQQPRPTPTISDAPSTGHITPPKGLIELLGLQELSPNQQSTALSASMGVVKETIARLIDLLRARNSIKNELRVQRTMIQSVDNNPLKFSATANDAIRTMFSGQGTAFMGPVEAVQDSFDDLSDHQVAVLAGMRAAYQAMFKHFSPKAMEARFGQSGGLLSSKQAKNWLAYSEYYQSLTRDSERTYDDLFGEEFAIAYEKQLADLKNARAMANRSRKP